MRHHIFDSSDRYPIALLCKASSFGKADLLNNYVLPLSEMGISHKDVVAFTLPYNDAGKAPVKFIKDYLESQLLPALDGLGVKHLYVADATYFKVLAGQAKAEPHFGYALPCKLKGYEHFQVVLGLNHQQLIYNPDLQAKLSLSLKTLADLAQGCYQSLGQGIIHTALYPTGYEAVKQALDALHQYPRLACDIETFSLRFNEAGIGTIAFAWSQHEGVAFTCDWHAYAEKPDEGYEGYFQANGPIRELLRDFFVGYRGELIFHNAAYDVKVLIATLWMRHWLDTPMLLHGLDVMFGHQLHDTKIVAYLATNSTAGNVLGLKSLAHEFAGNWAVEDIKDIRRIPKNKLLQYNLVDALSTLYVMDKFHSVMVQDQQEKLYQKLMLPSLKLIIQMELEGMPMCPQTIKDIKAQLEQQQANHLAVITSSPLIQTLNLLLQTNAQAAANAKLKVKQHPLEKFKDVVFNPNSGPQLQKLLYEQMGLPVIDTTDTGLPATGADTLEKLIHHTQEPSYQALLKALIEYGKVTKILSTFIPAFERGLDKPDGRKYLHGSFNLGGTVSGRLSSSDPKFWALQQ